MKKATKKTAEAPKVIKGYKGFDKDFCCNPGSKKVQYKEGETYEEPEASICNKGLHFCENPLDVLAYYPAGTSRFAEVEGSGKIDKKANDSDTKLCSTHLKVGVEISLHKLIESGIKFIFERTTKTKTKNNTIEKKQASNSGYSGAASNSGYRGAASNSGYSGAAFTIGNYSAAETTGEKSVAVAVGYENKAKASLGQWIVLAERNNDYEILDIKTAKIDGKELKADTWYKLSKGEFIES